MDDDFDNEVGAAQHNEDYDYDQSVDLFNIRV